MGKMVYVDYYLEKDQKDYLDNLLGKCGTIKVNGKVTYFTNTKKSDQPICFYELGKYTNYKDVISYQEGFTRALDVEFQLEIMGIADRINKNVTPIEHAKAIMKEYKLRTDPICYEVCDGPYTERTRRPLRRSR